MKKMYDDLDYREKVAIAAKRKKLRVLKRKLLIGGAVIGVLFIGFGSFALAKKLTEEPEEQEPVVVAQEETVEPKEAEPVEDDFSDVKIEVVINEPDPEEEAKKAADDAVKAAQVAVEAAQRASDAAADKVTGEVDKIAALQEMLTSSQAKVTEAQTVKNNADQAAQTAANNLNAAIAAVESTTQGSEGTKVLLQKAKEEERCALLLQNLPQCVKSLMVSVRASMQV